MTAGVTALSQDTPDDNVVYTYLLTITTQRSIHLLKQLNVRPHRFGMSGHVGFNSLADLHITFDTLRSRWSAIVTIGLSDTLLGSVLPSSNTQCCCSYPEFLLFTYVQTSDFIERFRLIGLLLTKAEGYIHQGKKTLRLLKEK